MEGLDIILRLGLCCYFKIAGKIILTSVGCFYRDRGFWGTGLPGQSGKHPQPPFGQLPVLSVATITGELLYMA